MRGNMPDDGNKPEFLTELRVTIDANQTGIEIPQATRDALAEDSADAATADSQEIPSDSPDLLGEMSDSLLAAYHLAKLDGDPLTVALIEKVLFHVGRRLARGLSPADVGIACH